MTDTLQLALRAAAAADRVLLRHYQAPLTVTLKADGSPVTAADIEAGNVITEVLAESGWPVLSEEAVPPAAQRAEWGTFWLVDPLDGTQDYVVRNDEFTVNLALIEAGQPTVGVISAPALDVTWFAAAGAGAWVRDRAGQQRLDARAPWPDAPRMAVSRFHDTPATAEFGRLNGVNIAMPAGSALKFAHVAAGQVEYYPRFNGSSEWDIAAGDVLLREAGAFLRTVFGAPPRYNQPSLRNPHFIAWRPPMTWDQICLPAPQS